MADRMDADAASEPHGRHPRVQSSARSKQSGQRCKRFVAPGATVCAMHGGKAPRAKAAAARRVAVAEAQRRLDIPAHVDPRDALTEELARSIAWVRWLGGKVDAQDDTALVWGATKAVDKLPGPASLGGVETTEEAKPSIWWAMYVEERKRLVETAKVAHACGVEDRKVQLAVRQAELLLAVVSGLVADLGHDIEEPATKRAVVSWLRKAEAVEVSGRELPGLLDVAQRDEDGA
jgi:hypothetical protein